MKKAITIALCLSAAPAFASAPKPNCIALEKLQASKGDHTTASPLTTAQFHFLQGVSAALPNTPAGLPLADSAILVRKDGGEAGYVIWTLGALACGVMEAPAGLIKMLAQIKAGDATGDDL